VHSQHRTARLGVSQHQQPQPSSSSLVHGVLLGVEVCAVDPVVFGVRCVCAIFVHVDDAGLTSLADSKQTAAQPLRA
jgi:hypothetical protein